jgi:hypothetical protein
MRSVYRYSQISLYLTVLLYTMRDGVVFWLYLYTLRVMVSFSDRIFIHHAWWCCFLTVSLYTTRDGVIFWPYLYTLRVMVLFYDCIFIHYAWCCCFLTVSLYTTRDGVVFWPYLHTLRVMVLFSDRIFIHYARWCCFLTVSLYTTRDGVVFYYLVSCAWWWFKMRNETCCTRNVHFMQYRIVLCLTVLYFILFLSVTSVQFYTHSTTISIFYSTFLLSTWKLKDNRT